MSLSRTKLRQYHTEVAEALQAMGNPALGQAIQKDRGSQLTHLGIRFPELRRRVKQGFSFYALPEEQVLAVWDKLWRTSPYGEVLFAALEFYAPLVRKRVSPILWPLLCGWSARVDNWCHSDGLSAIYSRILENNPKEIYPQIAAWNQAENEWLRRLSLVSLIHYSGKNAVFLPPRKVLPLITNCLADERYYVQTAVGWVLREMGQVYKPEITAYIEKHIAHLSTPALSRALERHTPQRKAQLRAMRENQHKD